MRFEFTYRFEDLREALETAYQRPGGRKSRPVVAILGWLVFTGLVVVLYGWMGSAAARRGAALAEPPPELDLSLILIPSLLPALLLGALIFWTMYKQLHKKPAASRDPALPPPLPTQGTATGAHIVFWVIFALIVAAIWFLFADPWPLLARPDRGELLMIALSPWAADVLLLGVVVWTQKRWAPRSQWNAKPAWRRDKVMIVDEAGVSLIDSHSQTQYCWAYFSKARETANLLILHSEENLMHLLPKHAIPEGELDQVRALIHNGIPDSQFLVTPGGFAVLPKPVLPVEPIS
jgi:hypothetical protein